MEQQTDTPPTLSLYAALQRAFEYFNARLFDGSLPPCMITLRSASRVHGYYHANRFISSDGKLLDELGIHPGFFTLEPPESVMSTLVHEMMHHWQHHFGSRTLSNPHNREWGDRMISIGLQPSHSGLPGGRETGRSMSDYILPDGKFLRACRELIETGFSLPWMDRHVPTSPAAVANHAVALEEAGIRVELTPAPLSGLPAEVSGKPPIFEPAGPKEKTRFKYQCPKCQSKAWAAEDASLICGLCSEAMALS